MNNIGSKDVTEYSLDGSSPEKTYRVAKMEGARGYNPESPLCVLNTD